MYALMVSNIFCCLFRQNQLLFFVTSIKLLINSKTHLKKAFDTETLLKVACIV